MNSLDDFVVLVRDEIGIPVTRDTIGSSLDQVPGWDSVHLLSLLVALERETSRRIAVPDALEASSLEHLYELAVAP